MKTIEEIADEKAKYMGSESLKDAIKNTSTEKVYLIMASASLEYAKQYCDEQKKAVADRLFNECKSVHLANEIYKQAMTTPNVAENK